LGANFALYCKMGSLKPPVSSTSSTPYIFRHRKGLKVPQVCGKNHEFADLKLEKKQKHNRGAKSCNPGSVNLGVFPNAEDGVWGMVNS